MQLFVEKNIYEVTVKNVIESEIVDVAEETIFNINTVLDLPCICVIYCNPFTKELYAEAELDGFYEVVPLSVQEEEQIELEKYVNKLLGF